MIKPLTAILLALLLVSRALAAATLPDSHADLSQVLEKAQVGTMIRIGTGAGVLEGRFQGMAPAGVRVMNPRVSVSPIVVLADSVRTVEKESRHTLRGALIGFAVGSAVSFGIIAAAGNPIDSFDARGVVIIGGLGGVVGAAMGHNYKTWDVIYP